MSPIDKLLPLLRGAKPVKAGQWTACCPAHADKNPSLKITETQDGVLLLKCWTGCSAAEIVAALDLEMRDLFPGDKPLRKGPSRKEIELEMVVCQIAAASRADGKQLSDKDQARLETARRRLLAVLR